MCLKRPVSVIIILWGLLLGVPSFAKDNGPGYTPPAPGSYELPPIKRAVDGILLDTKGNRQHLFDYMDDKLVILSFIYTTCSDICHIATSVLHQVTTELKQDPVLSDQVLLITLSFDPDHDTPEVMRRYAETMECDTSGWVFLTTSSHAELQPILDGYGQYIVRERDATGKVTGTFMHVLKVFLIDRERKIRNIYSLSFLNSTLLLNDIRTLLLEESGEGITPGQVIRKKGSRKE